MVTWILCSVLVACGGYALYRTIKQMRSGCCGGGNLPEKKETVRDRVPDHYPNIEVMKIEGMTCKNCVVHIENALNRLNGVFAQVDLKKKEAIVRMKQPISERLLHRTVSEAGYRVLHMQRLNK